MMGCQNVDTVFPYAWNVPRPAIGGFKQADAAPGIMYLTPDGNRKRLSIAELAETDEAPDRGRAVVVARLRCLILSVVCMLKNLNR